jgi:hypothetical protein
MKSLFKYTTADAAKKIFVTGCVRCAPLSEFNDPFDGQMIELHDYTPDEFFDALEVKLLDVLRTGHLVEPRKGDVFIEALTNLARLYQEGRIPGLSPEGFTEMMLSMARQKTLTNNSERQIQIFSRLAGFLHVFCMSDRHNELLMWSHYADQHRGVVLEFNASETCKSFFGDARPIDYTSEPNRRVTAAEVCKSLLGPFDGERWMHASLYTKSYHWSYEREWRAVVKKNVVKLDENNLASIEMHDVVALYLGVRIRSDDEHEFRRIVQDRYPWITVYKGRRHDYNYEIEFW